MSRGQARTRGHSHFSDSFSVDILTVNTHKTNKATSRTHIRGSAPRDCVSVCWGLREMRYCRDETIERGRRGEVSGGGTQRNDGRGGQIRGWGNVDTCERGSNSTSTRSDWTGVGSNHGVRGTHYTARRTRGHDRRSDCSRSARATRGHAGGGGGGGGRGGGGGVGRRRQGSNGGHEMGGGGSAGRRGRGGRRAAAPGTAWAAER
jgi:hypothetical protein